MIVLVYVICLLLLIMLCRQIVIHWPLVWRTSYNNDTYELRRQLTNLQHDLDNAKLGYARLKQAFEESDKLRAKAKSDMLRMQSVFMDSMENQWSYVKYDAIRYIGDHDCVTYVAPFKMNIEYSRDKRINLMTFSIKFGVSEDCPPEYIAKQIARSLETFILQNWQNQSILLRLKT